jgi:aryl-alcohol dehydrogenase-like predicted oxidoreductase
MLLGLNSEGATMDYANLGRAGLKVSRLALGTMNFGWVTDEPTSFSIMDEALDAGINFFDTSNSYGGPRSPNAMGSGIAEEFIGRWLAQGGRRDRIVLATKVYATMDTGPNDRRLSAYHIRRACEASLRRLQTDHIDLYQMHHVDRATPWEEIWQAMEQLIRQGKITCVGAATSRAGTSPPRNARPLRAICLASRPSKASTTSPSVQSSLR